MGVVSADDDGTLLAHERHELRKRLLDLLERRIVVEMVGLDVRHDHDIGIEIEEGAIGLVGLCNEILTLAVPPVRIVALDDASNEEARVELHAVEHRGDHGRRRRLAVSPGNGDRRVPLPELREHLGARPHRNIELSRAHELGIGLGDGGGDDHDIGFHGIDGGGVVTDMDINARARELANIARGLEVGTAHRITALVKHEGDAAHARPAYADKMDAERTGGFRGVYHVGLLPLSGL